MPRPATPYLRVDLGRLRRNVRATADRAAASGLALRPHVKTHKSADIARLQLASGAVGIAVATIGEAEVFARHGCGDIFIAYPVHVEAATAERLRSLASRATMAIGVDSVEGAALAGRFLAPAEVSVLVEVDCGQHRTGCLPHEAGKVGLAASRAGLRVRGAFTFPGHSYHPGKTASAALDESAALASARDAMVAAGLKVEVLSGGSSPSLAHTDARVVTETRPGVYVYGDAQQWELGVTAPDDIALVCRATVVSHAGGRVVLDSGSKALGADRASYATGFGRIADEPEARIVLLSEHHAVVAWPGTMPVLGTRVDVVPNHVCAAVNLADEMWVEEHGHLRPWPITARGRNT